MAKQTTQCFLESSAGSGRWRVHRLSAREALGEAYEVSCAFGHGDHDEIDPSTLVGSDATVTIDREGTLRKLRGVVTHIERASSAIDEAALRVTVRPAFALLDRQTNCRIFQEKTVLEILDALLGPGLSAYGRSLDVRTEATYPAREYCVQYRESDFAFACRLMQEEGIAFHFEHESDRETMVLTDANRAFAELPGPDGGAFVIVRGAVESPYEDSIVSLSHASELGSTKVVVSDWDWTRSNSRLEASQGDADADGRLRERYVHGHDVTFSEFSSSYAQHDDTRQAQLERELDATRDEVCTGRGHALGFAPGVRVELSGHALPELDDEYVITRVEHRIADSHTYENLFECIPADVVWRPERRAIKPRIPSVQSAKVVGPSGEEIHTDEHGRIKVQFHWDRLGANDDHSSCWLRVGQPWAGPSWGHLWIPRIGMEVIVDFASGNPDRPRAIGAVYNGENVPPYTLPAEKTKSTIKSNSSPGGGGSNELRFEDKAGNEEVYVHAQKDFTEVVLNDHNTDVGNNQTNKIKVDQTEHVGANQSMTVGANRSVHVSGAFKETIDSGETRTVSAGSTETITGGETRTVNGGLTENVSGGETRTVNGALKEQVSAAHDYTVGAASTETIGGSLAQTIVGGATINTPASYNITALGGINVIAPAGTNIKTPAAHLTIAGGGNHFVDVWYDKIGKLVNDLFSAKVAAIGLYSEESVALRYRGGAFKFEAWGKKVDVFGMKLESKGTQIKMNSQAVIGAALLLNIGFTDIDP